MSLNLATHSLLRRFKHLLCKTFYLCLRRHVSLLFAVVVVSSLGVSQLKHLQKSLGFTAVMDPDSTAARNEVELNKLFEKKDSVLIVVSRNDERPLTKNDVCALLDWQKRQARGNSNIASIESPINLRRAVFSRSRLWYMPWIAQSCDDDDAAPESGQTAVTQQSPLAELSKSPWAGISTTNRGTDFVFEIKFKDGNNSQIIGTFDPNVMKHFVASLKELSRAGFRAHIGGRAGFLWYQWLGIGKMNIINGIILLVLIVVCRLFFGTWRSGLMLTTSILMMLILLFSLMATFGHPVDMVSSGLFSIVTVAVIEDFFFLSHWRMNNPYTNWRTGFGMLVLPSFFTSLTTMIGFGSLYAAHLLTIRRLGLWAAVGAILEWVILFFVLPSVLKAWPSLQNWTNASRARGLSVLQRLTNKTPPRWVALLCLLLIPIGLVTIPYLHVSDDLRAVFRSDHPFSSTINYMERTRGWVYDASLVFRSEVPQDKVESILRAVKTLPEVKRVLSPWDILADATKGLPRSVAGIVETDFQTTSFNDRFYAKSGDVHVSVYMQQSSLDSFYSLRKLIEGSCPQNECFLAGPMTSYEEICGKLIPTLLESAGVSLALVAFVLFALCYAMRSLKSAPALVLSSLWCASVMIGLMALFQIPVNFLSCIVAAVLLGLAGDNGIMYLMTARPGQLKSGIASMSVASFQVTITAVAAVLVLSLSDLEPSRTLAKLCALGLTLNLFGDLWLLKGLVIDSKEEVGLNKR